MRVRLQMSHLTALFTLSVLGLFILGRNWKDKKGKHPSGHVQCTERNADILLNYKYINVW